MYLPTKIKLKLSLSTPLRHIGGMKVQFHLFLTSVLNGGVVNVRPGCITPGKVPRYLLTGGWVGSRGGSGRFGGEKNLFFLLGFKPKIVQPIA
jgi:hypothetical protein